MPWPWNAKKEEAPVAPPVPPVEPVPATKPVSPQEAIAKLKEAEKMLKRQSKSLERNIQQQLKIAKENARTNKHAALQALKRKRRFMKQLIQFDGQLTNLEVQIDSLENSIINSQVLSAVSAGAQALKAPNRTENPDYAHDVMDEMAEQFDIGREIAEIMVAPVGFIDDDDDKELMYELEELLKERAPPLPPVPTDAPVAAQSGLVPFLFFCIQQNKLKCLTQLRPDQATIV
ncbi:hypothetical protein NP493_2790g00008 [Ridgeia piscesae]|uniref:Uncharacterized protein n=1 Tax=Ridgeia piscesae TaxID=27915 RepID=A0AAD9JD22_RIDPI|nr:hypothetical protein NP493_2790g00008 [Ridgeia piscesae]